jgi:hypothetical protein
MKARSDAIGAGLKRPVALGNDVKYGASQSCRLISSDPEFIFAANQELPVS